MITKIAYTTVRLANQSSEIGKQSNGNKFFSPISSIFFTTQQLAANDGNAE